jgi:hypothetical protein
MLPGQLAEESYVESQRHPGDYEAQVSQRPIAIHGLEHLGATDRGVSMFRNQIRRGIRAVKGGDEPHGLCHNAGAIVPTYCNDTIVRMPAAEAAVADRQLMRETGRRLAAAALSSLRFGHQERLQPVPRSPGLPTVNLGLISRCGCLS